MKQDLAISIRVTISFIALALCFSAGALRAQSNLVVNGSFETGPLGQGHFAAWGWLGPAGTNSNYGVTNFSSGLDVAEQGTNYAYFRGHPNDGSQDCLGTSFSLKQGGLYNISYYLGTDGSTLGSGAAMWVVIGPSFGIDASQDIQLTAYLPNSASPQPYQQFNTIYLATNTSPILSFHGIASTGANTSEAILLDNVSVVLTYPQLNLSFSPPDSLVFTWPFTNSPYRLESSASLNGGAWTTLTNVPLNIGTNSQVVLPATTNLQFFRLTLP